MEPKSPPPRSVVSWRRLNPTSISLMALALGLLAIGGLAALRAPSPQTPANQSSLEGLPKRNAQTLQQLASQPSPQSLFDAALSEVTAAATNEGLGDNVTWSNMQWIQLEREDGILVRWDFNSTGRYTHFHFGNLSARLHVPGKMWLGYDLKGYNEQSTSYTRWHGAVTNGAGQVIGAKWYPTGQVVGDYFQASHLAPSAGLHRTASTSCISACQNAFTLSSTGCATAYSTCLGTALSNFNSCISTAIPGGVAAGGTVLGGIGFVVAGPPGAAVGGLIGGVAGGIGGYFHCYNSHQAEITACQNTYGVCLSGATSVFNLCVESCWTPPSGDGH